MHILFREPVLEYVNIWEYLFNGDYLLFPGGKRKSHHAEVDRGRLFTEPQLKPSPPDPRAWLKSPEEKFFFSEAQLKHYWLSHAIYLVHKTHVASLRMNHSQICSLHQPAWVGVTTQVGCSIILNAVKGQAFFFLPKTVDLSRSLQHRKKENLPYRKSEYNYYKRLNSILVIDLVGRGFFLTVICNGRKKKKNKKPDFDRLEFATGSVFWFLLRV